MIHFREHKEFSYAGRTKANASAHATIAIATDFSSAGEILTKKLVEDQKRTYIPVDISESLEITEQLVESIVKKVNSSTNLLENEIVLNIAGNGIYTVKGQYSQAELDEYVYQLVKRILESALLEAIILRVRTGGQTGIDEAGAKAANRLGIETLVMSPKGWRFRDIEGHDISNESAFKARFL